MKSHLTLWIIICEQISHECIIKRHIWCILLKAYILKQIIHFGFSVVHSCLHCHGKPRTTSTDTWQILTEADCGMKESHWLWVTRLIIINTWITPMLHLRVIHSKNWTVAHTEFLEAGQIFYGCIPFSVVKPHLLLCKVIFPSVAGLIFTEHQKQRTLLLWWWFSIMSITRC